MGHRERTGGDTSDGRPLRAARRPLLPSSRQSVRRGMVISPTTALRVVESVAEIPPTAGLDLNLEHPQLHRRGLVPHKQVYGSGSDIKTPNFATTNRRHVAKLEQNYARPRRSSAATPSSPTTAGGCEGSGRDRRGEPSRPVALLRSCGGGYLAAESIGLSTRGLAGEVAVSTGQSRSRGCCETCWSGPRRLPGHVVTKFYERARSATLSPLTFLPTPGRRSQTVRQLPKRGLGNSLSRVL